MRMTPQHPRSAGAPPLVLRCGALIAILTVLLAILLVVVRPWYLHWGATAEEASAPLPGSEFETGRVNDTRAIDIQAPAAQVFAWVAQLGQDRAGFYSYELLEDLVGCEMPDVRQLDPALQHWSVGDRLWMYPRDQLDGMGHATLLYQDPGHALVFGTNTPIDPPGSAPTGTWSFVVRAKGPGSARLLTRGTGGGMPSLLGTAFNRTVFEPLHYAMERRMLEGIKGLAEATPISHLSDALQLLSWLASGVMFVTSGALVLTGTRYHRRLLGFAASGVVFQIVTLVQPWPLLSISLVLALGAFIWPTSRDSVRDAKKLAEQVS
jgi:hypothetical protein